jgi:hypothetical protein
MTLLVEQPVIEEGGADPDADAGQQAAGVPLLRWEDGSPIPSTP